MGVSGHFRARYLVEYHETPKTALFGARVEKRIDERNAVLHAVAQKTGEQFAICGAIFGNKCVHGGFLDHGDIITRCHIRHTAIFVAGIEIAPQQIILLAPRARWA